jgi:hypothetical protein
MHDVEAVECRLHGNFVGLSGEAEAVSVMSRVKCLAILRFVEDGADLEADFTFATHRLALAGHRGGDAGEVALGGGEQILALTGALAGERAVAADDEPLARKLGER